MRFHKSFNRLLDIIIMVEKKSNFNTLICLSC